ncbi:MAG: hypothetical protein IPG93_21910 [Burkholderiales bacterium]|nr:hypothetical protein [Burkholderiales bacterium]
MPTPSQPPIEFADPRADRVGAGSRHGAPGTTGAARGRPGRTPSKGVVRTLALAAALAAAATPALAHEMGDAVVPDSAGWRLGAAAAVSAVAANQTWPTTRWPGQPGSGQTPSERRGGSLEHATVDLGASFGASASHSAYLALGQHGSDPAHTEAAWWRSRFDLGQHRLSAQLGRDRLPLGEPLRSAGHFDRYAQVPLIKRIVLNDDLMPDGLNLQWQRPEGAALQAVDAGVWRVRTYPGGVAGPLAPVLHLRGAVGDVSGDVFVAQLEPAGRATVAASSSAGHTHSQPDCRVSLVGVACFDGRTRLGGASLRWEHAPTHAQLSLAVLAQFDQGELYSSRGAAAYSARIQGGWVDLAVPVTPTWTWGARLERSVASHELTGINASLVAEDAGLLTNQAVARASSMLAWQVLPSLTLSAEIGTERAGSATPTSRWAGLRLLWSDPRLLSSR